MSTDRQRYVYDSPPIAGFGRLFTGHTAGRTDAVLMLHRQKTVASRPRTADLSSRRFRDESTIGPPCLRPAIRKELFLPPPPHGAPWC